MIIGDNDAAATTARLETETSSFEEGKQPRRFRSFGPVVLIAFGLFFAWRALPSDPFSRGSWLDAAGLGLGGLVALSGLASLALRRRSGSAPSTRRRPLLGTAIALATAAACAIDLLSDRSALVLVCGAVFLALLFWDKPKLLFVLIGFSAGAAIAAALYAGAPGSREQVALAAVGATLGVLTALNIRKVVAPGVERLRSLERENRELWDLSFRDGLTGLYNRRFAQETGEKIYARATRYHERFHVLMIDIDHFKRVNDKLGHAVGDAVLRDIASILQSCVRASDIAARYGGEEFIVFLIEAEHETAQYIANRIRDDVATHAFESVPWQVTISVGIAGREEGESLEQLVDRADKRLYYAKHSGRNRVAGF